MADDFALDTVDGLRAAIQQNGGLFQKYGNLGGPNSDLTISTFVSGSIYCGRCKGDRRVRIYTSTFFDTQSGHYPGFGQRLQISIFSTPLPALFRYVCIQCDAAWSALVYPSQDEIRLALLPAHFGAGGIASENTPQGVAYYLDQAARCHYISANSAAITMLRSALEWLLEEQGYTERMLGPKLAALDKAIVGGTAPSWVNEISPEYLKVIKDLGNIAAHTNGGELAKQDALDAQIYRQVELTFLELLEVIYERPAKQAQRLAELKKASGKS
jgi:hypothetical protein